MPGHADTHARARWYTPREVATETGLCLRTVHRALSSGALQGTKGSRLRYWTVPGDALEAWLRARRTPAPRA